MGMTRAKSCTGIVLACAAITVSATGCGSTSNAQAPVSLSNPTIDLQPPANPQATAATDQAMKAVTSYYTVNDQLFQNPNVDPGLIKTVASGQEATELTELIQKSRQQNPNMRQVGNTTVAKSKITGVNITGSNAEVTADVCYDVSTEQVVNAQGTPLPKRTTMQAVDDKGNIVTVPWLDQRLTRFTVTNPTWPTPSEWRVTKTESHDQPCT